MYLLVIGLFLSRNSKIDLVFYKTDFQQCILTVWRHLLTVYSDSVLEFHFYL